MIPIMLVVVLRHFASLPAWLHIHSYLDCVSCKANNSLTPWSLVAGRSSKQYGNRLCLHLRRLTLWFIFKISSPPPFLQSPSPDLPSPPRTPSYTVQQYGQDSVILTVQWQPPQYDGGAPVNYTITVSPGFRPVTTSGTSVPVAMPYNVTHTVSIVATNCNGSGSAAMVTIPAIGILSCY